MAKSKKRSGSRTRTRTVTKTIRSYAGKAKAKGGNILAGAIAGAGGRLLGRFAPLGNWAQPVADIATGTMMNNATLETIGGRTIGAMLANGIGNTESTTSGGLLG